ncbi:MAG: S9 family peptidase [Pirellulaceae bacterium]
MRNLAAIKTLAITGVIFHCILFHCVAHADKPDRTPASSRLTVERIYGSGEFSSHSFSAEWMDGGHRYTKLEATSDESSDRGIVAYDAATGERQVLVPASDLVPPGRSSALPIASFTFSDDLSRVLIFTNTQRVWRQNTRGDYWVLDRSARTLKQLGGDRPASSLMFAKFSPDGNRVAYVHQNDLYLEDLNSGEIRRLTEAASPEIINATSDWVNEEELSIRDGFRWSPDGKQIAFWQFDTSGVHVMTMINNTDQMYPRLIRFPYPKTGQQNSAVRIGVVNVQTGQTRWAPLPGDPRQHYIARIAWLPDAPNRLMLWRLNRLQNESRLMIWDPRSRFSEGGSGARVPNEADLRQVIVESDAAWLDVHDERFWMQHGRQFTWVSERDGWRRLYRVEVETGELAPFTPDGVDAIELLSVNEATGTAYVVASPENATQRYLYEARLDGSSWRRISPEDQPGTHQYRISADGQFAFHTYSTIATPPVVDLITLPDHEVKQSLQTNQSLVKKLKKLDIKPAELFQVTIDDGVQLDGWRIEPSKMKPGKKYPLLIYVYGEPAGTTVLDRWGGSTYLWHQMLAQQGFVVMSFDNRGTPQPRGRQWRKSIYRQVGILAPQDQAAAVRQVLQERSDLDPQRVGVWGWSGGGSMSLCALFQFPDLYDTAIAIAPVPNQRYYDTIYQERYMGLPSDNVEGYKQGSAITHAHQMKGNLLLIHGTGDDNCHYATSEMLIDALIRHNKSFDMMAYPNRSHGIHEGKNTSLHLRGLMTRFLNDNLKPHANEVP